MNQSERKAFKEAVKFFGKYFGIPIVILGFLVIEGNLNKPEFPNMTEEITVPDDTPYWDTVSFKHYQPKKKTKKQTLEQIQDQLFEIKAEENP